MTDMQIAGYVKRAQRLRDDIEDARAKWMHALDGMRGCEPTNPDMRAVRLIGILRRLGQSLAETGALADALADEIAVHR